MAFEIPAWVYEYLAYFFMSAFFILLLKIKYPEQFDNAIEIIKAVINIIIETIGDISAALRMKCNHSRMTKTIKFLHKISHGRPLHIYLSLGDGALRHYLPSLKYNILKWAVISASFTYI